MKKLARLYSNTVCANCGTIKKFGHSTVCIKFFTFVCNDCKSSHQAISHRCKSLTMSSWTDEEVDELERKGNDYARRTWLQNAPPIGTNGRPKEGDHIDVFKRFVVDAYERKKYYGEDTGAPPPQQQQATSQPTRPTQQPIVTAMPLNPRRPVQMPVPAPAVPSLVAADLLGFATAPVAAAPAPAAPSTDLFLANFDAFGTSSTPAVVNTSQSDFSTTPVSSVTGSAFGFMSAPPAPAPTPIQTPVAAPSTSFAFISTPPPSAVVAPTPAVTTSNNDFADFAGLTISSPAPAPAPLPSTTTKQPVMRHSGASQNASLISSMDSLAAPSTGFGGSSNMGMGGFGNMGGMNSHGMNSNNGMAEQQRKMMMMMQQQQGMMGGSGIPYSNMNGNMMMGGGMNNNGMMGGSMNNNMMGNSMMGGSMNNMMGGSTNYNNNMMGPGAGAMGIGMMTPQQMMMMMSQQQGAGSNRKMTTDSMSSLSLSGMDMNAWTTGKK